MTNALKMNTTVTVNATTSDGKPAVFTATGVRIEFVVPAGAPDSQRGAQGLELVAVPLRVCARGGLVRGDHQKCVDLAENILRF